MKKTILLYITACLGLLVSTTSCEDSTAAGGSLIQDEVAIVMDSTFTVTGKSVTNDRVQSRTVLQLIGELHADDYGAFSSSIVTQYMPAAALDTTDVKPEYIDSVKLVMRMAAGGFIGDSIVPMGVTAYELTRQLPSPIFSNFNPDGYYNPSSPIGSTIYSALIDGQAGVAADGSGTLYKEITIDLPREFGVKLYNRFKTSPSTFETPQAFADWFPGLYLTTSFGSGRVSRILSNTIDVYYRSVTRIPDTTRDTTLYLTGSYMGVTPEIITNNNITFDMASSLESMSASTQSPIIVAPIGYDIQFRFPGREIVTKYKNQTGALALINSLTFSIPAEEIQNDYGITVPPYILMVKKSKKDEFFAKSQLTDNINSFYAAYDATTRSYNFSGMRDYIIDLLSKDQITDDDVDFIFTPILISFYSSSSSSSYYYYSYYYNQSSQQINTISPYVTEPVMAKFNFDKAKIKFTFSKQTLNF